MNASARGLEDELPALEELTMSQLRERWVRLTGRAVPRVGKLTLRLALACEIQTRALGGLSRQTRQRLDQFAAAKTVTRNTAPGMRLVRQWNGTAHVVTIGETGEIEWNERTWKSLSEVARAITGTRWSGPAFFGLKRRSKAA